MTTKQAQNISRKNPEFRIQPEHQIELVFELKGVKYYKFTNDLNIPCQRAMSAIDIYGELEQKVTKDYLLSYCQAVKSAINQGKLVDVANLTKLLEGRLVNITELDTLYKLASVLYFDETENPYLYDYAYGQKKIKLWQQNQASIDSFFLQTPLSVYLPYSDTYEVNLENYLRLQRKELLQALEYHLEILSNEPKNKESVIKLQGQITELQNLLQLAD